jgi:RNase H-fold protein (predicted Holliday junction resolvase)
MIPLPPTLPPIPSEAAAARPAGNGPVAGLDPGRAKCGLVLSDSSRRSIIRALVLPPEQAFDVLLDWQRRQGMKAVVIGDGTGGRPWHDRLAALVPLVVLNEHGTTLAARRRYWELFPPRGWRRLVPEGLRLPPRDWDDVVAQLLLERWLGRRLDRRGDAADGLRTEPAP